MELIQSHPRREPASRTGPLMVLLLCYGAMALAVVVVGHLLS